MNKNKYLSQLKQLILGELKNEPVKVLLFGSRARGDEATTSDVDIGYIPGKEFDIKKIIHLKNKIEESHIPYTVEFVNLNEVNNTFRQQIQKDAVIWKD